MVYAVFGVAFAAAGLVPATTVVTRWFHERRSVALSVASTGLSVGGILITPFAKRLIDDRGLAAATPWLGLVFVVGIVPFAWFLVRPDPAVEGWNPDGKRIVAGVAPRAPSGWFFEHAVRTRFFIAVTIGYIFALGSQVGGIQQLVKLVEDRTDPSTAAVRHHGARRDVGRGPSRRRAGRAVVPMMRFTVLLVVLQCVALVLLGFAESTWLIFTAIVLFGMTIGNILMLQPLLIAERFGVRDYPRIFSRSQLVAIVGTAGGPLLIGWLYDAAGSYRMPYTVAAACSFVGVVILSVAGPATFVADD